MDPVLVGQLHELAGLGCWDWDLATGVITWSDQLHKLLGVPVGEVVTRESFVRHVHPDDRGWLHVAVTRALEDGADIAGDMRVLRPDGTELVVHSRGRVLRDAEGRPVRMIGTCQDVTERSRGVGAWWDVTAAREATARLEEAQKLARMGSWEADVVNQRITWSAGLYYLYGLEPQPLGPNFELFIRVLHPDDRELNERALAEAIANDTPVDYHFRIIRPDGQERVIHTVGEVIRDEAGNALFVRGTGQDVTEVYHLDRMKIDFVHAISHELRTPITSILGYADFLDEELPPELSDAHSYTAQIRVGAKRLSRLVADLGDFALLESGAFRLHREPTDLAAVVLQTVAVLRPQLEQAGVQLLLDLPAAGPELDADRERLGQVVANFLENAAKASRPGGQIAVRLAVMGPRVRIEVEDGGVGIPEEAQAKVFTRFTGFGRRRGSGLGLGIAKALIEAHGGEIGFTTQPGRGSTFFFELPLG